MIDENVIYKEAYKAIVNEDWFFDKDVTGAEVGNYIIGVSNLVSKLIKEIEKESNAKEEESNWGQ